MLRAAKYLKDNPSTRTIYILQWLQPDELAKLKSVHDHCRSLNQKSAPTKDGRPKYVVISGKLFERTVSGALRPFKDVSSSAPSVVSSGQARALSASNVAGVSTSVPSQSVSASPSAGSHPAGSAQSGVSASQSVSASPSAGSHPAGSTQSGVSMSSSTAPLLANSASPVIAPHPPPVDSNVSGLKSSHQQPKNA